MSRAASWLKEHELAAFYAIALFLISGAIAAFVATGNEALALLGVIGPALSALFVTRLAEGKDAVRELLLQLVTWRVRLKWYLAALLLIPAVAIVAIVLTSDQFPTIDTASILPKIPILLVLMTGEEIGWRGFALPRLQQRYNALTSSLVLGVLWGLWHFPGYLGGLGVPLEMSFVVFMIWVMGGTILITWVYNNTRSVLLAVLMHVFANLAFGVLPLLPEVTGEQRTFLVFVGLICLVSALVVTFSGPENLSRERRPQV